MDAGSLQEGSPREAGAALVTLTLPPPLHLGTRLAGCLEMQGGGRNVLYVVNNNVPNLDPKSRGYFLSLLC